MLGRRRRTTVLIAHSDASVFVCTPTERLSAQPLFGCDRPTRPGKFLIAIRNNITGFRSIRRSICMYLHADLILRYVRRLCKL
ncbi:hypothetical protein CEXT_27431 [Caerostris extrusa]|uniref:Secreted protein n=1 Tax=Caerostris extrusa TaxID=172846 RepID=A0AAV4SVK8_CAEEX|nr:hypothetical protein CEXT_27431 [Caerostris extrusa]